MTLHTRLGCAVAPPAARPTNNTVRWRRTREMARDGAHSIAVFSLEPVKPVRSAKLRPSNPEWTGV